ncbi:MAG TPA: sigma-70 family RNA polymerase sigma factor [Streptosporangiaceae bacterium]|nr:sigma-70 family RNA polymerase sigma factor [Streptosporangiaceae bacterium]
MAAVSDPRSVVEAAAGGDETAWRTLVDGYSGLVWSVIRAFRLDGADAADAFQTTWLRLAEHIGRLNNPEGVGAWLATVARRECLQNIKASVRTVVTGDMDTFDIERPDRVSAAQEDPTSAAILAAEQQRQDAARSVALWEAFEALSGRCRELLRVLMATPPPSYAEVAAALEMPVGSIGPTRARCLERLRAGLAGRIRDGLAPHE